MKSYEPLVENNAQIMAKTKQIFGQGIFNLAMKATVYGQFVAGEDKDKIKVDKIFNSKITFSDFL